MKNKYNLPHLASDEAIKAVANGCGASGWKYDLVPDKIYGADISLACNRHDYRYHIGRTAADKRAADKAFFMEIMTILVAELGWSFALLKGSGVAASYYIAVSLFGGDAFYGN